MLAETVVMQIQPGGKKNLGEAQVTADFRMRNLGAEPERMAVRFPISANDGRFNIVEIRNLQVQVDGRSVNTRRIQGEDPFYPRDPVPWAEFDVSFPPGKDVNIHLAYTLDGTGYDPFTEFYYILSTGAGWKDSIGSADVVVRLPYEAQIYNVLLQASADYWYTSPGAVLDGNEIRWHYDDLEPAPEDNLEIELVAPSFWKKVLAEQANIERNPRDGEAWGRLGKAYKESAFFSKAMRTDEGGKALFDLSVQAYEKCRELRPDDAEWHAGFGELFYLRYYFGWENPDDYRDMTRAVELVKRAYEINPASPKALELLETFGWEGYVSKQGDGYDFLLLTATPTPYQTATPPSTPTSTAAPLPSETPTPPASDTPEAAHTPTDTPTTAATLEIEPTPTAERTAAQPAAASPVDPEGGSPLYVCGTPVLVVAAWLGLRRRLEEKD